MSDPIVELHCARALGSWLPQGYAPYAAVGSHGGAVLAVVRGRAVLTQTEELDPGDRHAFEAAWFLACAWAWAEERAALAPVMREDGGGPW